MDPKAKIKGSNTFINKPPPPLVREGRVAVWPDPDEEVAGQEHLFVQQQGHAQLWLILIKEHLPTVENGNVHVFTSSILIAAHAQV